MAEKIRPLHLPPTSTPSQQSLLVPTSSPDGGAQHGMSVPKPQPQQVLGHHPQPQGSGQPDIALHARSASGSGTVFTLLFAGLSTEPQHFLSTDPNVSVASNIKSCQALKVEIEHFG